MNILLTSFEVKVAGKLKSKFLQKHTCEDSDPLYELGKCSCFLTCTDQTSKGSKPSTTPPAQEYTVKFAKSIINQQNDFNIIDELSQTNAVFYPLIFHFEYNQIGTQSYSLLKMDMMEDINLIGNSKYSGLGHEAKAILSDLDTLHHNLGLLHCILNSVDIAISEGYIFPHLTVESFKIRPLIEGYNFAAMVDFDHAFKIKGSI